MSATLNDDLTARAIHALFAELQDKKYSHWCPTPETQELTMKKRDAASKLDGETILTAKSVHDIWAWSIPVSIEIATKLHSPNVLSLLQDAGILTHGSTNLLYPTIRVSNLYPKAKGPNYYAHSPWPTSEVDSVFFGPDSYRYTRYMGTLTKRIPNCRVAIDMCTGAGVGAVHLALEFPDADVYGLDINPKALKLARINAAHLCPNKKPKQLQMLYSDAYTAVQDKLAGIVDVIAIDPPFIADDKRTYAQGGYLGIQFTLDMLRKSFDMLRVGGEAWLHMAAPITFDGRDVFREEIEKLEGWEIAEYEIIDVDIFGNEMGNLNTYPGIGNLASVGLVLKKIRD
jgi:hypothetical protein